MILDLDATAPCGFELPQPGAFQEVNSPKGSYRASRGPFRLSGASVRPSRPSTQDLFVGSFACTLSEPCLVFQRQEQATIKIFRWLTKMDLTELRS